MLQLYYESIEDKDLILITESDLAPLILNNLGVSRTVFLLRNIGTEILSDVSIAATGISIDANLQSYVSDIYTTVEDTDLVNGIDWDNTAALLEEVYPGETIKLTIATDFGTNVGIDFNNFTLDIGYTSSYISIQNILTYYLFLESNGSLSVSSSSNICVGTVSDTNIIKGNGIAYFEKDTDSIVFSTTSTNSLSMFAKIILNEKSNNTIYSNGNLVFGLNSQRCLYATVGGTTITTDKSLEDYNQEHIIGLSLTNTDDILITIDGSIADLNNQPSTPISFAGGASHTIGGGLSGEIDSFALYNEYKTLSFHNEFYLRSN